MRLVIKVYQTSVTRLSLMKQEDDSVKSELSIF